MYLCSFSQPLPPYNGFGSLEDSMQSCFSLIPQPPKKDFIKMLENDGKVLRYSATLVRIIHALLTCALCVYVHTICVNKSRG